MALQGINGINIISRRGAASKAALGIRGISVELPDLKLPVLVTDRRGRGLAGATVRALNTTSGNPSSSTTDSSGGCLINADASTIITASKDMAFENQTHNAATLTDGFLRIVLEPPII